MTSAHYGYLPDKLQPQSPPSRLAAIRGLLGKNKDLLRNAGSLAASTGVTSVLGFAYWIYAARVFPPEAVGYGSAAISAMTLLGTIGMFGLGTMLIGELPTREARGELITAALIASFIGSLVLGIGFAVVSLAFGSHFVEIAGTVGRMAIFALGVAVTGATLVFDDATIGLMRGGLQLNRNVAVSITKMAALPVCSLVLHDLFGVGIMLSWVLGTVVSLIPVIIVIRRGGGSILYRPDWKSFWQLGKVTLAHNWLNLSITVPVKLIPVLVVVVVSPASNAAYYIAAMLASFLFMVPLHLSTVLFAIASAAPEKIGEKLRFVLRMSLLIGVPGGLILGLSSHFILSIFGSSYASLATGPLWIILATYIPGLPNTVYIAVCRATGRVNQAAVFLTVAAVAQMAAVVIGGHLDGLYGLTYGILIVAVLEALVTTPPVLRAAFGHLPVRSTNARAATDPAYEEQQQAQTLTPDEALRRRQEAGLAALFAMATTVAPERHRPAETSGATGMAADLAAAAAAATAVQAPQPDLARTTGGRHRISAIRPTTGNPVLGLNGHSTARPTTANPVLAANGHAGPAVNGHAVNGHAVNGHPANGHAANGHAGPGANGNPGVRATTTYPAPRSNRLAAVRITAANAILGDTSWWQDGSDATFHARQEAGMAALISVATHAARF